MKLKLCLYTLCCCLIIGLAHAQIRRTTKMPDFFVPQGALSTTAKPEKLPPIESMRFNGQQAPIVLEMQQKATAQTTPQIQQTKEPKVYERAELHTTELPNTKPEPQPTEVVTNPTPEPNKPELTTNEPEIISDEPQVSDFDRIIAEYKHDRDVISKGQPLNNQRLNDMIADFQDLEHEI